MADNIFDNNFRIKPLSDVEFVRVASKIIFITVHFR